MDSMHKQNLMKSGMGGVYTKQLPGEFNFGLYQSANIPALREAQIKLSLYYI
jgi:hypothetical protein